MVFLPSTTICSTLEGSPGWVEKRQLAGEPFALNLSLHGSGDWGVLEQGKPVAE
jgi:hypothetical protein